ncbi:hypothetical protein GCM10011344_02170 [Dokdonia pacifica]|nr:FG-GAP-like repeat-containing protein [Dokdonia pacifica]GGG05315.1 hypothetical protein GCM10011344_02170 [Dokdonia pacifica]
MRTTTTYLSYVLLALFVLIPLSNKAQSVFIKRESTLITGDGAIYGDDTTYGAGISFYDFDNDGWDDITLPASTNKDFQFFRNINGIFTAIELPITSNGIPAKQAIWVDFDNDNDADFFGVSEEGAIWFYRNDGNFNFTNIINTAGFTGVAQEGLWSSSWGDYDNDGFLDVFLSMMSSTLPSMLFHNNGDGTFTDVSMEAGLETEGYNTFCASFFDYDNDGDLDIYLANNFCPWENILYSNDGDGSFINVSNEAGVALEMLAMSTTIDDYNDDGYLDIFVTNWNGTCEGYNTVPGSAFLTNNGNNTFNEVSVEKGVSFQGVSWGATFLDADNDGDKDLFVASNGTLSNSSQITTYYEQNTNGSYSIPSDTGLENDQEWSYGNAIGDINNDGYPDVIVLNAVNDPIYLLQNIVANDNSWLKVKLQGTVSNTMGIGAVIKVTANGEEHYNYTLCGEGYISQNSGTEFFGLGSATNIDAVEVYWPSGIIDRVENITINQAIEIEEGQHPLAIEEESISHIKAYPNPVDDYLKVSNMQEFINGKYELFDSSGRLIHKDIINTIHIDINFSSFESGLYFVKFTNGSSQFVQKVIKS